jgi:hypothetical protein
VDKLVSERIIGLWHPARAIKGFLNTLLSEMEPAFLGMFKK